ncbi:acyl-CoA Delta-9 desaturase-like [Frankliniella occidentalis]|uniref:Acyl-CoA Delta-9 desaturase-like n=1 Tax=Frankliniella occidentalis TaxID=133901 RepID=A0A6J1S8M8_FRAOC|nr:acyl-CoA Delta-9 desaturase-like [Frankliniella occidentalis]
MPPNVKEAPAQSGVLYEDEAEPDYRTAIAKHDERTSGKSYRELQPILWDRVAGHLLFNALSVYAIKLIFTDVKLLTTAWAFLLFLACNLGVTSGVHRLWSHKAYKAKLPLRILLAAFNTMSWQGSIYQWAIDHRAHHKFTETDADHVNARRGFFFSHVGWLLCKKHPDVIRFGKTIDSSDLLADPVVYYQKKYYYVFMPFLWYLIPVAVPMLLWDETHANAFLVAVALRFTLCLHAIFLVNSAAHMVGSRPYDKSIAARENFLVALGIGGEGYHNYHHVFPWDYKSGEFSYYASNYGAVFIELMAKIGQATHLKSVNRDLVMARCLRTGDGTHPVWGWGDKDMSEEDKRVTIVS